jgi:Tfp pilus assembly protein PilO
MVAKLAKNRFALMILGAVVVAVLWLFLYYRPQQSALTKAQARGQELSATVNEDRIKLAQLVNDRKHDAIISADLTKLQEALPTSFSLAGFLQQLNSTAARDGVVLSQITPASSSSPQSAPTQASTGLPPQIGAIQFSFQGTGQYSQLLNFLHDVERMNEIVTIDSLQLSSSGGSSSGGPNLTLSANGRVYYHD